MASLRGSALLLIALLVGACQPQGNVVQVNPVYSFAERPKNIVLLIGDGFGLGQMSALMYQNGNKCSLEAFPFMGWHKPTSSDELITDSAASATAFATGVKTFNSAIGVNADTLPVPTILEQAEERGLATGLIATAPITHATPAAFIAHQALRTFNEAIAEDFLKTDIDLFIGGGQKYFERRNDERNLIRELKDKGYYVSSYFDIDLSHIRHLDQKLNFAYFTADVQPVSAYQGRNYLPYAAYIALPFLDKRSDKGFFIMIEGSQIDWAGHGKDAPMLLSEVKDFDDTIREVLEFAAEDRETLVIVTGDHECGGVAIQPGSRMKRVEIAFTTNGHTASLVPVYAYGPKAELFTGIYDNTQVYHKMVEAFGWEF